MFQQCLPPMATVLPKKHPWKTPVISPRLRLNSHLHPHARMIASLHAAPHALGICIMPLTFTWMPRRKFQGLRWGPAHWYFLELEMFQWFPGFLHFHCFPGFRKNTSVQVASTNLPSQGHTRTLQSALALAWEKKNCKQFSGRSMEYWNGAGYQRSSCYQWVTPPSVTWSENFSLMNYGHRDQV